MGVDATPHTREDILNIRLLKLAIIAPILMIVGAELSYSQSKNTTTQPPPSKSRVVILSLGGDQIGTVKTAEKLSTRVSFPEPIKEIICGDLYDPSSGTGAFVVQRIESDVFIKPVASRGESNMFVNAGERGEHTYNLLLVIVPSDQASLIVKVIYAAENAAAVRSVNFLRPPVAPQIRAADFTPLRGSGNSTDLLSLPFQNNWELELKELYLPPKIATGQRTILPREPIKRVLPEYPQTAKTLNIAGEVTVEVTIDKKGNVKLARTVSGSPLFITSALSAARRWRFTSADDVDVDAQAESLYRITFRFKRIDGTDGAPSLPGARQ